MKPYHEMQAIQVYKRRMAYLVKRYIRNIVIGAVASCFLVNVALHVGVGLQYFCVEECTLMMLKGKISAFNKHLIEHVRDNLVDQPAPRGSYKPDFDVSNPPWSKLGGWGEAHTFVMNYFKSYKEPGKFIEIGAQDGEFMSMTLFLEQRMNFTGLLVEPNPHDYEKLLQKKRSAYSINACASPTGMTSKEHLWLRHNSGHLPHLLSKVQEGSNRLFSYVSKEDRELGDLLKVQCLPISTMSLAAMNTVVIDIVTISTHGGELDVLASIVPRFAIRVLVLMTPITSQDEEDYLKTLSEERGLTKVFAKSNIHIFLPKREVVAVEAER